MIRSGVSRVLNAEGKVPIVPEQDTDAAVRRIARLGRSVRRHVARSGLHRDIETGPDLRLRWATGVAVVVVLGSLGYAVTRHHTPPGGGAVAAAVAQPSPSASAVVPIDLLPPPPPPSRSASPARSASPGLTRPATTAPRATTAAPEPPAQEKRPPPLTADYVITRSFDSGFVTEVTVKNVSGSDQDWQVRVSHAAGADVAILRSWSADVDDSGPAFVFTGPALPPGGSQTFGFEATKRTPSAVRPTQCTVNGSACTVTLEG
jgi:hypothetical protein